MVTRATQFSKWNSGVEGSKDWIRNTAQKMCQEILCGLARSFASLLNSTKFSDVSIKVGQEPNTKTFPAHSAILGARSQYFAAALSDEWAKRENNVITFAKPNISPVVFEIILNFIYSGEFKIEDHDIPTILDLLVAADELRLEDLIAHCQFHLCEQHTAELKQSYANVHRVAFQSESFKKLQNFCVDVAISNPKDVFESADFTSLEENALISILKRDDLVMEESEIWEYLVRWGAAQVNLDRDELCSWTQDNFSSFYESIKNCINFIRFYNMSSSEFYYKVKPFSTILPVYEDLLRHYLVPGVDNDKAIPRMRPSKLATAQDFAQFEDWINGSDTPSTKVSPTLTKFELLLRGSRDGFAPSDFHRLCDGKGSTITVAKVKESGQVIGGYSPISWHSSGNSEVDTRTFIFSLGTQERRVQKVSRYQSHSAIWCDSDCGPAFGAGNNGNDFRLMGKNFQTDSHSACKKSSFKHSIMDGSDTAWAYFNVEDYEVFRVIQE